MNTKILMLAAMGLLTAGITSSCGDSYFDVSSKTESNSGNYFKTQNDAYYALIGCYDGWQRTVSNGPTFCFHYAAELLSDECLGGTGNGDARNSQVVDRWDIGQDNSQVDLYNTLWQYYYQGIYRCNELLSHQDEIAWTDSTLMGQYMGEARAMRAIMYFDLVRLFERVPLLTAPSSENIPQSEPSEIYAQIVEDLKYAAANIPADAYPKAQAAANDGRITSWAAKAFLARVYLFYNGVYGGEPGTLTKAEALQGLEDVIASGEYSLIPLYKNLWYCASTHWEADASGTMQSVSTYAGDGNAETVLAMKFNYTSDYNGNAGGNNAIQMFSLRGGTFKAPYGQGWGGATVVPGWKASYPSGDQRAEASIIDIEEEGIYAMADYQTLAIPDQREYTGYTNKKYTARSGYIDGALTHLYQGLMAGDFQISQPIDYVVMRYADVLLMAAELGSSQAQTYVNMVHERAYRLEDGSLAAGYSQIGTSAASILEERRLEFAFEGLRWFDLRRQDSNGATAAAAIAAQSGLTVLSGGTSDVVTYNADNITAKRGFLQIPLTQIQLTNNVLTQNQGW